LVALPDELGGGHAARRAQGARPAEPTSQALRDDSFHVAITHDREKRLAASTGE